MSKKDKLKGLLHRNQLVTARDEISASKDEIIQLHPPIYKPVNTAIQQAGSLENQPNDRKKKATFELDESLHTELKVFAAKAGKKMVDIVEEALIAYLQKK